MKNRRKPSFFDDDFFGEDFGKEFERLEDAINEMMREHFRDFKPQKIEPGKPLVYGFSMRVGANGKPHIRQFGNLQRGQVKGAREPLVDVIDGEKEITVVGELPGVDKQHLQLRIEKNLLRINVTDPARKFAKIVRLPAEVLEKESKARIKNGILEVTLKKKAPGKPSGTGIKVE